MVHPANFIRDVLGDPIQRVEILVLENQFELRLAETDLDGGRQVGDGDGALDFAKKSLLHAAGTQHDFLHGTLALAPVLETHKDHPEVRLPRPVKPRRHDGAVRVHLGNRGDDSLRLA